MFKKTLHPPNAAKSSAVDHVLGVTRNAGCLICNMHFTLKTIKVKSSNSKQKEIILTSAFWKWEKGTPGSEGSWL